MTREEFNTWADTMHRELIKPATTDCPTTTPCLLDSWEESRVWRTGIVCRRQVVSRRGRSVVYDCEEAARAGAVVLIGKTGYRYDLEPYLVSLGEAFAEARKCNNATLAIKDINNSVIEEYPV